MRWLATGAAVVLMTLGVWSNGAASGYEHGKTDAANALRPHGMVVLDGLGACTFYEEPGSYPLPWRGSIRAYLALVVRPQ